MPLYDRDTFTPGTLSAMQRACPWVWVWCHGAMPGGYQCNHHAPFAVAPLVIRFGPMAPAERMLSVMRCGKCGYKGASFQHPSWGRDDTGLPFPVFPVGPRGEAAS